MANTASPPAKCGDRPAPLSRFTVAITVYAALVLFADSTVAATAPDEPHVRHKRTVSEFVEDIMNAVYFHLDPLPLPSTVIARISHMPPPTSSRVSYKYIPMKKMKLTKVRARNLADPKMKYKYPKKYPTNAEDSMAALTKNDLPWTLHPLPPPLSTSKSSTIEADKNVPWALHPLPPPVKTRNNYHEYYWHDPKNRPVKYKNKFKPIKPFHFMNYNPFNSKPMDYNPAADFKPADFKKLRDLESPGGFKDEDFNTGDFKSVGYKPELHNDDDDDDHRPSDADRDHHEGASSEENMASSKGPGFVATHITIEPSVEIASFSETEMQGDGTTNDAVSHGDRQGKHRCQCIVNGHRHKRQVDSTVVVNGTDDVVQLEDARVQRSHGLHSSVGHATEVVIQRSHDITDRAASNGNPINYVQQLRGGQNAETISVDDGQRSSQQQSVQGREKEAEAPDNGDKFAMNYGREINNWDESRSSGRVTADDDKFSLRLNEDNEGGNIYGGGQTDDGYGRSRLGSNADKERRVHFTKSTVGNTGGGVAFSVQTPFSVASFSSNVGHPGSRERQSRFRYTNSGSPSSSSSSPFSSDYSEPLDFEQFGLQSAVLGEDKPSESGQLFAQFSKGFDDRPSSADSGRLTTHFSRDFENGRDRPKTFRYGGQTSDRPTGGRLTGGNRDRPNGSFLEYFQPVVIDFEKSSDDGKEFKSFGENNDGNGKLRYFGKSDSPFPRFKKHDNPDPLRLPGRLHESNEHLSRKSVFHPSTFDID